jgi:hypothetical protein
MIMFEECYVDKIEIISTDYPKYRIQYISLVPERVKMYLDSRISNLNYYECPPGWKRIPTNLLFNAYQRIFPWGKVVGEKS